MIEDYSGLRCLCECLNDEMGYNFTLCDVVYFIRHVCIAEGCHNACAHCFANAPYQIKQTDLYGYERIMNEIGRILCLNKQPLHFFHMGASTDPAYVNSFAEYLKVWMKSFPRFQQIKIFSHGWYLDIPEQRSEFSRIVQVVNEQHRDNLKFVLSFDHFSALAKKNRQQYQENFLHNLLSLTSAFGKRRVRVEVFYTPRRIHCETHLTLQYWIEEVKRGYSGSFLDMINECKSCSNEVDIDCAEVTSDILSIFSNAGFKPVDLIEMTRDCNSIFPAGRGIVFFDKCQEDKEIGLTIQKKRVLYSLEDYKYKYDGVIITPEGRVQMVNYSGYQLGKFLNNGERIIDYMSVL
jgi:hypothetical protein